jgi:predicted DNA-binding protein (UPF0251 family)
VSGVSKEILTTGPIPPKTPNGTRFPCAILEKNQIIPLTYIGMEPEIVMEYEQNEAEEATMEEKVELISIAQASDRLGVSSRTFYRYLEKYRDEVEDEIIDDGTLKLTPKGVAFFREALNRRDNRGRKRKGRPRATDVADKRAEREKDRSRDSRDSREGRERPRHDESARFLEKELEITRKQVDVLETQILDLKEQRGRLIGETNDYRGSVRRLQEERDKLLFEVAEWRGLYGRIEDQRALVVVAQKETFFNKIWRSFSTKK